MPKQKPDKYWNEKQLARDFGSGLNDVIGRGTLAGLLGAPADIMNLGENGIRGLLGLPQVTAWGGSEHIGQELEKAGLVSSVRRPKTELLASLISPSAAAKTVLNAPKTARNMLKALDNLDAPNSFRRGLGNSQVGAIDVWHGSPHKFDEFKAMDNIGGGEGAQAYGHGGYHASNPEVANSYAKTVVPPDIERIKHRLDLAKQNGNGEHVAHFQKLLDEAQFEPNLYRNQLRWPDPAREAADPLSDKHFLDWDKPLSEQDASVRQAINGLGERFQFSDGQNTRFKNFPESFTGKDIYKRLGISERHNSKELAEHGIPGIRYLDGGSRSAGQGSHNYVTFDDALVNILERNGQPVGNLSKLVAPQDEALRVAQQNAALPVEQGGLGLRVDNTPEERAAAMGFDTDAYHGRYRDYAEVKDGRTLYATQDPEYASIYTNPSASSMGGKAADDFSNLQPNVMPIMLRSGDILDTRTKAGKEVFDTEFYRQYGNGSPLSERGLPDWVDAEGFGEMYADKGLPYKGVWADEGGIPMDDGSVKLRGASAAMFDPTAIRSRFAAFDPMKKDSADLLAGLAPLGLGALIAQPKEKKKKK